MKSIVKKWSFNKIYEFEPYKFSVNDRRIILDFKINLIFARMKPKFKIICSVSLLAVILFASIPKVYIHSLLGHVHKAIQSSTDATVSENGDTQDCNFQKYDTPVYYSVFKFILNFLPLKETKETSFYFNELSVPKFQYNTALLRGPPIA